MIRRRMKVRMAGDVRQQIAAGVAHIRSEYESASARAYREGGSVPKRRSLTSRMFRA